MMGSLARRPLVLLCGLLLLVAGAAAPVAAQTAGPSPLFLTQTVDHAQVQPGGEITFTLTFVNGGAGNATGVSISDVLPPNTTFAAASGGGVLFGNTVFWSAGTLGSRQRGTVTLQVNVSPTAPPGTAITNVAQISSVEAPVGAPSNSVTVTVAAATPPSVLTATLAVDVATASPGSTVSFLATVSNPGSSPATNVTLVLPIPAGTVPVTAANGGVVANGTVTWALGTLMPGDTRQETLTVQVTSGASGAITGAAQVSSAEAPSPVSSNSVTVPVNAALNLSLTESVDKTVAAPGDTLTYTLTFTPGAGTAPDLALFAPVPAGTQFIAASNGGVLSGDIVAWSFANLPPGTGGVVTFMVRVAASAVPGTLIQSQAQLAAPSQGAVASSSVVTTTVTLPGASLTLAQSVDRPTAQPGTVLNYTFTFANTGGAAANGVVIVDPLPAGLDLMNASAGGQIDAASRTLSFNLGTLAPDATGAVSFQAQVDASVPAGTSLTNQAQMLVTGLAQPVLSNAVTVGVVAASFTGTYKLILNAVNPTSVTVDPQNELTISTIPSDGATPNLGAQGSLNADGSFNLTTDGGQVQFTGRIDPAGQTATVTVHRAGLAPYTVTLPRAPDFNPLPAGLAGTFEGFATNAAGDQLRVFLSIDAVGNSTFVGDLIQFFPLNLRWAAGSYQVTPDGQLGYGGRTDGLLRAGGSTLLLIYNFIGDNGYQSVFQVPLVRR